MYIYSHGEALTFEPLLMREEESRLRDFSVLAIASVTQAIFLMLSPKIEALTSLTLKGSAKYLPQLAWNHVVIEHRNAGRVYTTTDAVLAAVRERSINYVQCSLDERGQPSLKLLRKFEVPFEIMAFQWVDAYTVAALDPREIMHLLSVKDDSEVEAFDLARVELVYNSSFFKSIETGGNVSQALIVGSEHACYNSVVSYNSRLHVLGLKAVHVITIKTWKERLRILIRDGRMDEAIQLGLDLYENKARAVVGLSGPPKKRREQVAEELVDILKGYVDMGVMMQKPNAGGERELQRHYKVLVRWAFDVCLRIKKHELLFTSIYDTFSSEDNLSKTVFLEHLCGYIVDGKIRHIRTLIVKDFIAHYSKKGDYQLLEKCFLQILPQCLDIHQVVEVCLQQQLYDALIHVHNRGLRDYGTPLLELLLQLRVTLKKAGKNLPSDAQKLGYKLLVYIRCCASGMGYPTGKIPPEMELLAKTSMYEVLLAPTNTHNHNDKEMYPHMCTLLHFDTREFLNVIALAFEETDFDAVMSESPPPGIPTRQEVVSILLKVMTGEGEQTFSPSQVGSLFTFLARQGAKHRASIHVDETIYDQVLNYITHTEEDIVNEERQQALLELWHVGVLKKFDEEKLLVRAEAARFYRLCEQLYEKRRQFGKVLSCYLRDPHRTHQAFSYVHAVMNDDQYTEPDREEVSRAMLDKFQVLVEADVAGAARLVLMDFPLELSEVTHRLQATPDLQFRLLQGIFDPKQVGKQELGAPSHVVERYIELLCRYQPQDVYGFLHSNDNYRVEEALDVCSKAKLMDATAYLLERSGDILGAFKLIRETLGKELEVISEKYYRQDSSAATDKDLCGWVERVEGILMALLTFCQRNSSKLASEDKARQSLWFPAFDRVHDLQRKYKDSRNQKLVDLYNGMISTILNAMLGYVSLQDILQKIIQDPSYQFKDIKQLMMGMLETYNYEETLLKTTNHILVHDVRGSLNHLCTLVQQGVSPYTRQCVICSRPADSLADGSKDDVIVFSCGHLYHASCLGVDTQDAGHLSHSCVVCHKTSTPSTGRGRSNTMVGQRGRSFTTKRSGRDEVGLDPVQRENLRRLNMSFRSKPDIQPSVTLQLAPPRL
jgi:hypothetical protein